jgi:hypothetical protein
MIADHPCCNLPVELLYLPLYQTGPGLLVHMAARQLGLALIQAAGSVRINRRCFSNVCSSGSRSMKMAT